MVGDVEALRMNGHTSNRMVAVSLASRYMSSKRYMERLTEKDMESLRDYHQGQMDAVEEVAILLGVDGFFDEVIAAETARRAALSKS
jgi:hypothetical protein